MPTSVTKRQPLSCENCRKRKIRCTGNRTPCDTCVRRGFAQSCHYVREAIESMHDSNELLARVRRLESLLENQISDSSNQNLLSVTTSRTAVEHQIPSPCSIGPVSPNTMQNRPLMSGWIKLLAGGYQRFVPDTLCPDSAVVDEMLESTSSPASSLGFPFSAVAANAQQSLLDFLPPGRQCEELKSIFFQVFSPLFHVLHDPTFDAAYEDFRRNPGNAPLAFVALLFVILAIAVTALDETHPLVEDLGRETSAAANIKTLSEKYRMAAMRCLAADHFLWQHNLRTLQALILLIYAFSHSHGPAWALLGTALNISVTLGCHIDPSRLRIENEVECEERRRCWAALMMLYTIQNTTLGNISPQRITATVNLPADVEDDNVLDGAAHFSGTGSQSPLPTKMTYILYKFRLYQLAAEVCEVTHDMQNRRTTLDLDRKISNEENEHSIRFSSNQHLPLYHVAHHYILKNYTFYLRLIIHRPYLRATNTMNFYDSDQISPDDIQRSRQHCQDSAIAILNNHELLYESEEFKGYRWYVYGVGSFHAFLAASTLLVLLTTGGCDNGFASTRARDLSLAIVKKCLRRFEKMAARSDVCAKAVAILGRLLISPSSPFSPIEDQLSLDSGPSTGCDALDSSSQQQHQANHVSNSDSGFGEWIGDYQIPQLQSLVQMPPEQWLAGPSAFTWDNWLPRMSQHDPVTVLGATTINFV